MILNIRGWARALYLTLSVRRITWRRVVVVLIFALAYPCFLLLLGVGRLLDDIFFRGYRSQKIRGPIYVLANPRSGTTFLHRLMCLDEEHFTHFTTYHVVFPAVSFWRLIDVLGRVDGFMGGRLSKIVSSIERRVFRSVAQVHAMGFALPEEDELLFLHNFFTPGVGLLFPFTDLIDQLKFCDRLPHTTRRRLMRYYQGCLQRRVYACRGDRYLLLKNVLLPGRIQSILETFPDAKFIHLVRHPYEAIPSTLSGAYTACALHSPEVALDGAESRALAQMCFDYYRCILESRNRFPKDALVTVHYQDLLDNPKEVVERLLRWLDLPVSDAFTHHLTQASEAQKSYRSGHRYSLEQYSLTKERVYQELRDVFEAYGLAK